MARSLSLVALVCALALAPPEARGFDWIGKIELDADGLDSSDPQLRLQAVQRLGRYDIVWTKEYLLKALRDSDRKVRSGPDGAPAR